MSKGPSPLLGFNNNVRHKGRVFHIQTEDSGIRHPHVITHLFMDGGRIVKTTKTSYAEHLQSEKLQEIVRDLMKQQHKAMFVSLRDGEYDEIIAKKAGGSGELAKVALPAEEQPKPRAPSKRPSRAPPEPAEEPQPAPVRSSTPPPARASVRPPSVRAPSVRPPSVRPPSVRPPSVRPPSVAALRPPAPDPMSDPGPGIDVDVSAIERAAAAAATDAAEGRTSSIGVRDLPPPPAAVLQKPKSEGTYREVASAEPRKKSTAPSGRYSVRPPPALTPPRQQENRSIFGEDLISEKSLDEVILSYLAEDLDGAQKK